MISRREFLSAASKIGLLAGCPITCATSVRLACAAAGIPTPHYALKDNLVQNAPKARYWTSTSPAGSECVQCHESAAGLNKEWHREKPVIVKCLLCAQKCIIKPGERGKCRARMNVDGELRTLVYGRPVAINIDPIEKKPFYHFLPGSTALSLATSGCPLSCKFCQNWEISQSRPEDFDTPFVAPEQIVQAATKRQSPVIAFTYNEPTVFMEYLADIATLASKQKLRSVLVSCGFMNPEPLKEMCELLDAIKIDLKGVSREFYGDVCGAELKPVLDSIRQAAKSGVHLEIVNLVVPTLNDSDKMLKSLIDWIAEEIGPDVPVHFTRFHPDYRLLNLPPTPVATLERFRDRAMSRGLHYVYVGNVPGHPGNHTYCPQCGKIVIQRSSYFLEEMNIKQGCCSFCGRRIAGVWS
ncbi:MAG: AmmeMemoRadiSam system radical SAM enzyme [Acidobacteria bacterium]|nr:AmmeMemoRadiSam system radical SAM enzyme [Acidobacteriota bacterium]